MLRPILLPVFLFLTCFNLSAQQTCGADEVYRKMMQDPDYRLKYDQFKTVTRNAVVGRRNVRIQSNSTVYSIPIVFHIMHKGEPLGSGVNLTDETIVAVVKGMNERYRKIPGSIGDGHSVDMQFQFVLAVQDPDGNCTNGINRVDMSSYQDYMDYGTAGPLSVPLGMEDADVRALSSWDSHYYCNVWIVSDIYGYAGYAFYPDQHGNPWDGVMIKSDVVGDAASPALTHELGHYIGLRHVFEGGDTENCPVNNDCAIDGDGVCDTPPQLLSAPCEPTPNSCAPGEILEAVNYMGYSCMNEFTEGQKELARNAFEIYRSSLLEENGNLALVPVGTPAPDFTLVTVPGACMIAGDKIQLFDHTLCIPNTLVNSWEGSGVAFSWIMTNNDGATLTSTDQNPAFAIPAEGSYDVTLTVTSSLGTNSVTQQDFVIAGPAPAPDFTLATSTCMVAGAEIQLLNSTPCLPNINVSFDWTITDNHGVTLTSTDQNPAFTIPVQGSYDVTLAVTTSIGTNSVTKQDFVIASAGPAPDFTLTIAPGTSLTAGSEIQLINGTPCLPNTNVSFNWTITNNHGVTRTSTDQNPAFTLPVTGNYDVTLAITTPQGTNSITKQDFIVVGEIPQAPSCVAQTADPVDYQYRGDDIGIREVILNDLDHLSGTTIQDAAGGVTNANGYGDFSGSQMANLEPFTEYTISVVLSDVNPENVHVYIDFDNNGITEDDLVTFAYNIPAGSGTYALPSFASPDFPVYNTRLRMRVVDEDIYSPYPETCGVPVYGQAQDYSVIFNNSFPVANDDAATVNEDEMVVIDVADNDSDADGTLLAGSVDMDFSTPLNQGAKSTPEGAWLYVQGNRVSFKPIPDFNGTATLEYTVTDDKYIVSNPATITVTVTPVNDLPSFTKGADQFVNEGSGPQLVNGWATVLSSGPPDEALQELTFSLSNDNNALFAVQPSIDANGDLTYTSANNTSGSAIVSVVLSDNGGTANGGVNTYTTQTFTITVAEIPQAPSCVAQTADPVDYQYRGDDIGIREVILNDLDHLSGSTVEDAAGGVTNANGYGDFSGSQVANLEPFTEYTISVVLSDVTPEHVYVYIDFDNNGISEDDLVTSAHDVPAGSGMYALPSFITPGFPVYNTRLRMRVVDEDINSPYPEACGAPVYGQIEDYSVIFNNVFPVALDDAVAINEDQVIVIDVTSNDSDPDGTIPAGTVDMDFSIPLNQGTKSTPEGDWLYVQGNKVSFTPKPNFNGVATLEYTVQDNRYTTSNPATIIVTVNAVNDPPSFTKRADQIINEDSGPQLVSGWATALSTGPSDESSQELTFTVMNDNHLLFIVQPSIDANGDLTYASADNASGSATVSVVLSDNGGTANGGINTYATQTFLITVNPVNDPPVVVNYSITTMQGTPVSGNFSAGDSDPDGSINYETTPVSGPDHGMIVVHADGTFIYTPDETFAGTEVIIIEVCDDGTPSSCTPKTLTITVEPQEITGIESTELASVSVYPNPSTGTFILRVSPALRGSTIKVSDLVGKIIHESRIDYDEKSIDLSEYAKGIYLLQVERTDRRFVSRITLK
ncbi:MAG TPA: Ig-like domain-containing protein [Chryseolinea sp.]|nr:Ig-like domain-containing protein [Chryseolinea sp.]